MSDRLAVMNAGRIEQVGSPAEVYEEPLTPFVAGFVGTSNMLTGDGGAGGGGLAGAPHDPAGEDPHDGAGRGRPAGRRARSPATSRPWSTWGRSRATASASTSADRS